MVMKINRGEIADTADGLGFFSCNMYKALGKEDGNLFFSPYSISSALSLAYLGAEGETKSQMAKVLGYRLAPSKVISTLVEIGKQLNSEDGKIVTNVANAAWLQQDYEVLKEYLDVLEGIGDLVKRVDFVNAGEVVRQEINSWVEKATENLIKDLIPKGVLNALTRLVLVNAVYFNGKWASEFDPELTEEKTFYNLDGSQSTVQMMHQANVKGSYVDGPGFQAIQIPYGHEYSPVRMTVILPDDIRKFEAGFDFGQLVNFTRNWHDAKITLSMPKFKMEHECELSQVLSGMGMGNAFQSGVADFSGVTGEIDLSIDAVIHKAVVEVSEEGTEAAAATAVVMLSASMTRHVKIDIDRPFIFIIGNDSPLFMGRATSLQGE
jgi:serpin B